MQNSLAIFWDIENVTPGQNNLFINGLIDYTNEIGKISIATAYGDWTKPSVRKSADSLAENSFELIHVPRSKKNSTDMTLITNAIETIHQYSHVKTVILVAGDSDFRPLLLNFRKHGIYTIVICDAKSASEDLLMLADEYKDFRDLMQDTYDDADSEKEGPVKMSIKEAFSLLREAISIMERNRKTTSLGAVKVRMKLLNEDFDESKLGFRTWKKFILKAADEGIVSIDQTEKDLRLSLKNEADSAEAVSEDRPLVFTALANAIKEYNSKEKKEWAPFSAVNNYLLNKNIDVKQYGYSKLKRLIQAAEKRNIVETMNKGLLWFVKLV